MEGRRIGRYVIGQELAAGGMATVHLGRMQGPAGFGKTVAIKRLHAQFAKDADFARMFLDEARVTSGLMHPNIVMTLDVLDEPDGLYLVMEYVHGVSLAQIQRAVPGETKFPLKVTSAIVSGFLEGLHAAHEATDDGGEPLGIVHRDVSPQNVLVSFAGITKIADFGIAKAAGRMTTTGDGSAKGKLSYMAPEQVNTQPVTPRTDVFAAGIVLWECLTREKLIPGTSAAERLRALLDLEVAPPSSIVPGIPRELDAIVLKALARDPARRFASAKEMAAELQRAMPVASSIEVSDWAREVVPELARERDTALAQLQRMLSPQTSVPTRTGPFEPPPISTPSLPVSSQQRLSVPSSQGETSGSNVSIKDYFSRSERHALPPKMPRAVLIALIVLPGLGVVGALLVLFTFMRSRPVSTTVATAPPAMTTTTPAATATIPEPPPSEPATASASAIATPAGPAATDGDDAAPAAPTGAVAAKPKAVASSGPGAGAAGAPKNPTSGKKCRIVATPDKSGRMKFEEVCTP